MRRSDHYPITLLYDGACAVCRYEMHALAVRDGGRGRLRLVDIADPALDPRAYPEGTTRAALNAAIHAVDAQGTVHRGMAALRLAYGAVGLGWALRPTALPLIGPLADAAYRAIARHRYRLSRWFGPLLDPWLARQARATAVRIAACHDGRCTVASVAPTVRGASTGEGS